LQPVNERGIKAELVETGADCAGAAEGVDPGWRDRDGRRPSLTLTQIGVDDFLIGGQHPWKNLKDSILSEKDTALQMRAAA